MTPSSSASAHPHPGRAHYTLALLTLMSAIAFMDRQILAVLIQPVKLEFGLSDLQIGMISGLGFALSFALLGVPLGRLADRGPRRRLIVVCRSAGGLMAALGAAATGFWSLMLSRCGNALSDAGGGPASMALVAEAYPVQQRSRVLSIYGTGASLGALLTMLLGAWVAQHWGWRWTLAAVGAASVLLALLLRLTVAESRAEAVPRGTAGAQGALRDLLGRPLLRWLLLGAACAFLAGYGFGTWNFTLLLRRQGLNLSQAGLVSAGAALGSVLGGLCSGALADRLVARDARWQLGVPVAGLLLAMPCGLAYLLLPPTSLLQSAVLIWAYAFFVIWWAAPVFAAISLVVGATRRATASALILMTGAVLGNGLGPVAAGWLSDLIEGRLALPAPGDGLRWSLVLMVLTLLPGALAFGMALRAYPAALRRAREEAGAPISQPRSENPA